LLLLLLLLLSYLNKQTIYISNFDHVFLILFLFIYLFIYIFIYFKHFFLFFSFLSIKRILHTFFTIFDKYLYDLAWCIFEWVVWHPWCIAFVQRRNQFQRSFQPFWLFCYVICFSLSFYLIILFNFFFLMRTFVSIKNVDLIINLILKIKKI